MLRILFVSCALATPAIAAEDRAPGTGQGEIGEGMDLLSEGARRLVEGLLAEVEPHVEGLADTLRRFEGPSAYYPPEMLPNGDIIIRRREPKLPAEPDRDIEL